MSQQLRPSRLWKTLNWVAGGSDTIDLPIGEDLESIQFYLHGTITNSVTYTACKTEGMGWLIQSVDLLANGETIASLPFTILTHGNFGRRGSLVKTNPPVGVAANYGEIVGYLDLAHISGVRPKDSNLRTLGYRSFQLRLKYGQLTDMYTGAGTTTGVAITLDVAVDETIEQPGSRAPEIRKLHRMFDRTYPASVSAEKIQLDPDVLHRAIVLRTELNGDLSSAVINNVKIQVGSTVLIDYPAAMLYDKNSVDNNGTALTVGYLVVDFARQASGFAKLADCLDLHGRKDAYLILNITGAATAKVQYISHQFEELHDAIAHNASNK